MRLLDIIIPQYSESEGIVERLLRSINNQKDVDFTSIGILIVNDCSNNQITTKITSKFPKLNIELLRTPINVGPGLTRQYGIDHSSAQYITFIDADDVYYSSSCLQQVVPLLLNNNYDIILTKWMEEFKTHQGSKDIVHTSDIIYLHGKFIKRQYLIDNDFKFSEKLRLHEDSYFCTNLLLNSKNIFYSDVITNYWKNNNNSLVRKKTKHHYLVNTFEYLLTSNQELIVQLTKRNNPLKDEYTVKAIVNLYCILASSLFNDKTLQSNKKTFEKKFFTFLQENLESFENVGQENSNKYMLEQINIFKKTNTPASIIEDWNTFITRLFSEYDE